MEADWDEIAAISLAIPTAPAIPPQLTALAFDTAQELLWTGSEYGRVTSLYGADAQRYTSYRGHREPVKQIVICEKGVVSLSSHSVHLATRHGITQWHLMDERFADLRCLSLVGTGRHEILVAGCQQVMFKVDLDKGEIVDTIPADDFYTIMKRTSQYICAATNTGSVHILQPSTLQVTKSWKAHNGMISDMDAKGEFLVTCGSSPRHHGAVLPDPFALVFSLKTLQPFPPIAFQTGAAFVRMFPRLQSTTLIASLSGQLQVIDIMNPNTANVRQANMFESYLTALEIAPSGEAIALSDNLRTIRLWGSPAKFTYPEYSKPTDFPDELMPVPQTEWSPDTPLSTIGMPVYREKLLSHWPASMVFEVGMPPQRIDPDLDTRAKDRPFFTFRNPRKTRRNQVEDSPYRARSSEPQNTQMFKSERNRGNALSGSESSKDTDIKGAPSSEKAKYAKREIKYSRFGVEDFDFEQFNKTQYSGLETHIANSYANALLQLYRFTPIIRNLTLRHTATSCLSETCILCELGFLIDMLEKANGINCQAKNLLKTFNSLSAAASLGLLEEQSPSALLSNKIQSLNRFLLDKMSSDYRSVDPSAAMDQVFSTSAFMSIRCAQCNNDTVRPDITYVQDLIYKACITYALLAKAELTPEKNSPRSPLRSTRPLFSQILKMSVERQDQTRGWCDRCKRYQQLAQRKSIRTVPPVLMINTAIQTHEAKQLWSTPHWLPQEIGIIVREGLFHCYEGLELDNLQRRPGYNDICIYELVGVVADISLNEKKKAPVPHLVSLVNASPMSPDPQAPAEWLLFNDFTVEHVDDPLTFNPGWKLPSVVTYQLATSSHIIDNSWQQTLDMSILFRGPISRNSSQSPMVRPLDPSTERPVPGTPIAIDAEFVSLLAEEIDVRPDGTKETLRPAVDAVARISVLRASGPYAEVPFIDDYIAVAEPIVDYRTAHSGIREGDLDRTRSNHPLISLKLAYKRLWILLNFGCVFVGHGLTKDFRGINIHVPKKQTVDTVQLYRLPDARLLNLRFLAWWVLKQDIQTDTHDSIEDAATAARLWQRWKEWNAEGVVEERVREAYRKGKEVGFLRTRIGEAGVLVPSAGMGGTPTLSAATPAVVDGRLTPDMSAAPPRSGAATPRKGLAMGIGGVRVPMFGGSPVR